MRCSGRPANGLSTFRRLISEDLGMGLICSRYQLVCVAVRFAPAALDAGASTG
jgi:hypothetical protein